MPAHLNVALDGIPNGYVAIETPDKKIVWVPGYMIPETHQAFDAYHTKIADNVFSERTISGNEFDSPCIHIIGQSKNILIPPDPKLTDQELLSLHAEIKALQQRFGISYKDASHRLYMAEVEKLKQQDSYRKDRWTLEKLIDNRIADLDARIEKIVGQ